MEDTISIPGHNNGAQQLKSMCGILIYLVNDDKLGFNWYENLPFIFMVQDLNVVISEKRQNSTLLTS